MMSLLRSFFREYVPRDANRRKTLAFEHDRRLTFENLEVRAMLSATLLNTPSWVERGPSPILNAAS